MTTLYIDLDDDDFPSFKISRSNNASRWSTCIADLLHCTDGRLAIEVPNFIAVPLNLIPKSLYKSDKPQIMTYLQTYYPEYLL
jgi:hypothetical protein